MLWLFTISMLFSSALPCPAQTANTDPTYQKLRNVRIGPEAFTVNNLVLKREAGEFRLTTGTVCLLEPVEGKVTGAVFTGTGSFKATPHDRVEAHQLAMLSHSDAMEEDYAQLVLRFSDATADEIRHSAASKAAAGASCPAAALADSMAKLRFPIRYNLSARLLQDVLSEHAGGLFAAFIYGKKYSSKMLYVVDPHGVPTLFTENDRSEVPQVDVAPEEVMLVTYEPMRFGVWLAQHLASEYADGTAKGTQSNAVMHAVSHALDTTIEKNGLLSGTATTTVISQTESLRVLPFDLYQTLRVSSVTDGSGQALAFIQEDKKDDSQFFVILPKALKSGESVTIKTTYAGKDAVRGEGDGNYYPIARTNWYPNTHTGDYASYEMTFRVPKNLTMAATGTRVSAAIEGNQSVTKWKSDVPITVAGFNFGEFKQKSIKLEKQGVMVQASANKEVPALIKNIRQSQEQTSGHGGIFGTMVEQQVALGNMTTTPMIERALGESQVAVQLYTDFFGPIPYKQLEVTQQTALNYGEAWPGLVFLPLTYFLDGNTRHQLGMDDPKGYFRAVTAHEVAHQWWGDTVGWTSYRDQWMSEGFAEFSASLFIQIVRNSQDEYLKFWRDQREQLVNRNREGVRAIDAGPLSLGSRLANSRAGFNVYNDLIYPKGAFVLHMLRMMMWTPQTGDKQFQTMMQEFTRTYANRTASTGDFKAIVEKHMSPAMDLDRNHKMDWFFDEWVYGSELPDYAVQSSFERGGDGKVVMHVVIKQSNVSPSFRMVVPIYVELADGHVTKLGTTALLGNSTFDQKIPLGNVKETPRRALTNYQHDVLANVEGN